MKLLISVALVFICFNSKGQLVVSTGALSSTQYVEDVLIGNGITVSNVTFTGDTDQIGEFDANLTIPFLGMAEGLILATGDVNVAIGPNNTGSASLPGGNFGVNDVDLDILEGATGTNDAAVLEFDFVSYGDSITCSFILASEEYPEYVASINDVFGVFLSGPGISGPYSNGAENVALIPGTTDAMSINNINSTTNSSYYVDNTVNTGAASIQFDGYSTVISIKAAVQVGVTYHVKIAIGDASDTSWDSGVFVRLHSFEALNIISTSVNEKSNSTFVLWPNPSEGLFYYKSTNLNNQTGIISVLDVNGKEVYRSTISINKNNSTVQLNLSQLNKGIYFVKITTLSNSFVKKLVIN